MKRSFGFLNLLGILLILATAVQAAPTTFEYRPPLGEVPASVSLRGTMNDWGETRLDLQDDGIWRLTLDLPPGEHLYKFFVDGQWPSDMSRGPDGSPMDLDADDFVDDGYGGKNAVRRITAGDDGFREKIQKPLPQLSAAAVRIHYHRPDRNYDGWGLHVWEDAQENVTWTTPLKPAGTDGYGVYWDVQLRPDAKKVGFIVHRGEEKDPGPDQFLVVADHGYEVWLLSGRSDISTTKPDVENLPVGDLAKLSAHWVDRSTILWSVKHSPAFDYRLHYSPEGNLSVTAGGIQGGAWLSLTPDPHGLSLETGTQFPHLRGRTVLKIDPADLPKVPDMLRGQIAVSVRNGEGTVLDAAGIQIPGVLDDLFAYDGELGVSWQGNTPQVRIWAPTAKRVRLLTFNSDSVDTFTSNEMSRADNGVWSIRGLAAWKNRGYLFEVQVFVPATGVIETNRVTDPYSRSLSANSTRSLMVNLADPELKPRGWDSMEKPPLEAPEDIVLYELHVRDFSASDATCPEPYRGTYMAFTADSDGTRHLRGLAEAGLTHLHLLPVFDIATINENAEERKESGDLSEFDPADEGQQAAVTAVADLDAYNWGYDPYHYGVPEGSYATEPNGSARIVEFRSMVQALAASGLRVVMDVVYNHTHASGQDQRSVLDRIVPGYYHRLNETGAVETSTCCQNTASEHAMMAKLMVDDLVHWARDYKIDGFRFDLMGHHMRYNMIEAQATLQALTLEQDGVDGRSIYLYGEGWDFGEVSGGKRGTNATQAHMAGTGIGTFNDRIRDALRGGNPFNDRREQGFLTGRFLEPNGFQGSGPADRAALLEQTDRIRFGLTGNLRDFELITASGQKTPGGAFKNTGYASDPQEAICYVSAHDNETLFDKIQYAAKRDLALAEKVRMQQMGLSLVGLSQGVPFFHAGVELLRSKSLDADSYNSGDWFNRLDFSYRSNNFAVGLPPAGKNQDRWPIIGAILTNPDQTPGQTLIRASAAHFREILAIRRSSPLFRLRDAGEIRNRVRFHNTGPSQDPGLIVMSLSDRVDGLADLDPGAELIFVLFNADNTEKTFSDGRLQNTRFALHPLQRRSADPRVQEARFDPATGNFTVPGRTTAVFVAP